MAKKNKDIEILVKLATQGNFDEASKQLERLKNDQTEAGKTGKSVFSGLQTAWKAWTSTAVTSAGALRTAWLTALGPISALIILFQTLKSTIGFVFTAVSNYRKAQEETNRSVNQAADALQQATFHKNKYANAKGVDDLSAALKTNRDDLTDISKKYQEIDEKVKKYGMDYQALLFWRDSDKQKLQEQLPLLAQAEIELKKEIRAREEALELAKKQEEAEKKRVAAVESVTKRIQELTLSESDYKRWQLDQELAAYEKAGVSKEEIARLRSLAIGKIAEDEATKAATEKEREARTVEQIELDLDQKMAALGEDTFQKKQQMMSAEIAARRAKINAEKISETDKQKLLAKLDDEEKKRTQLLADNQKKIKQAQVMETLETSLNAISILNDMESGHTKAQAVRAKVILALEKAIAIARIWSAPSTGPWDAGLKVAQTAVVVAQFAQQAKAINQAQDAASSADATTISTTTDIGNGKSITEESTSGGSTSSGSSGSSSAAPASVSSSGSQVIFYGGDVNIFFDAQHVDISEIDTILRKIGDAARSGTVEGVRMSVSVLNAADKNAGKAV